MPRVDLKLEAPIARSPRVTQVEGIFDVPAADRSSVEYHFDMPLDEHEWRIGLIKGPSGSGKSSVAREVFGDHVVERYDWPEDAAIVDCFPEGMSTREITTILSKVGFSSPPDWLKPYKVLSTGQRFRCDLARAIADPEPLVVVDEFTSVVDRTAARIGSHAVQRAVRSSTVKQLVAVTCHDDVEDWLQPDWVCEPGAGDFRWREQRRRPAINLEVCRVHHSAWRWFYRHHYLTATLNKATKCFVGFVDGREACFAACIHRMSSKTRRLWAISRTVTLPDFQGVGLGVQFGDFIARMAWENGAILVSTPAHPALIQSRAASPNWDMVKKPKTEAPSYRLTGHSQIKHRTANGAEHRRTRKVAQFRWVGGGFDDPEMKDAALRLWR